MFSIANTLTRYPIAASPLPAVIFTSPDLQREVVLGETGGVVVDEAEVVDGVTALEI